MSADCLFSLLNKLKCIGPWHWRAHCPFHEDHRPSLFLRKRQDGAILIHCFAGCDAHSIVFSAGLSLHDLFPRQQFRHYSKGERRPFPATAILRCISSGAWVVVASARAQLLGPLSDQDNKRLILALSRIEEALAAGGITDVKR